MSFVWSLKVVEFDFDIWARTVLSTFFAPVTLTYQVTFMYELDLYSLEIHVHGMCKYELPTSRLSKVIV